MFLINYLGQRNKYFSDQKLSNMLQSHTFSLHLITDALKWCLKFHNYKLTFCESVTHFEYLIFLHTFFAHCTSLDNVIEIPSAALEVLELR